MSDESLDLQSAAVVCEHVAKGMPILMAVRESSVEREDSGWQFVCNRCVQEDGNKAQVWLLGEVIEEEPSLLDYMVLPAGSIVVRQGLATPWEVRNSGS